VLTEQRTLLPSGGAGRFTAAKWRIERTLLDELILDVSLLGVDVGICEDYGPTLGVTPRGDSLACRVSRVISEGKITHPDLVVEFERKVSRALEDLRRRIQWVQLGHTASRTSHPVEGSQLVEILGSMKMLYADGEYDSAWILYEGCKLEKGLVLAPGAEPVWEQMEKLAKSAEQMAQLRSGRKEK
jgi:hypothetical protein